MRVKGSVVVVTGASSGIGRATALRFAEKGADVVVAARRADALEELAAECRTHGVRALAVPTDVSDSAAVEALAELALELGGIDVLVNDAAVGVVGPFLDIPDEDFRRVLDVNVMGYVHGARAALRQMRLQGRGVLVNVSSVVAEVPQPYTTPYTVSKAAVRALSESLRSELEADGVKGVHVCTVLPATTDTPWYRQVGNYTGDTIGTVPPVYSAERVAKAVVGLVRDPEREVTVGAAGRSFALQHKMAPRATEASMRTAVDRRHIRRRRFVEPSTGNLYEPSADPRDAAVSGGWGGRRKSALRRVAAGAAVAAGIVVVRRATA